MGFGRRNEKRNNRDNGYRKKRKLKTTIRLVGIIVVIIGFMVSLYDLKNPNSASHQQYFLISIGLIVIGMAMILQENLIKIFKTPCQCCRCQNCGRNHNHWTHD